MNCQAGGTSAWRREMMLCVFSSSATAVLWWRKNLRMKKSFQRSPFSYCFLQFFPISFPCPCLLPHILFSYPPLVVSYSACCLTLVCPPLSPPWFRLWFSTILYQLCPVNNLHLFFSRASLFPASPGAEHFLQLQLLQWFETRLTSLCRNQGSKFDVKDILILRYFHLWQQKLQLPLETSWIISAATRGVNLTTALLFFWFMALVFLSLMPLRPVPCELRIEAAHFLLP